MSLAPSASGSLGGSPPPTQPVWSQPAPNAVAAQGRWRASRIGEKLTTNAATGTGSFTVPIATSPGRAGFELALQLDYDSGAGNGPFGLGGSCRRRRSRARPTRGCRATPTPIAPTSSCCPVQKIWSRFASPMALERGSTWSIAASFACSASDRASRACSRASSAGRITRPVTHTGARSARDNLLSVYGQTAQARNRRSGARRARVLVAAGETRDDRANVVCYRYKAEDAAGVDPGVASEANRFVRQTGTVSRRFATTAQRYLKRIQYGNRIPVARDQAAPANDTDWLFEAWRLR